MTAIRVLGLDPGLRATGWGLIDVAGNRMRHVANGTVAVPRHDSLAVRLNTLFDALAAIIERYEPTQAAVEETFVNRNAASALKLGHARAAALLAPARIGVPVAEYAATVVKKAVVGTGRAEKSQVAMMVSTILPGSELDGPDAADALAVAICHAHHLQTMSNIQRAAPGTATGGRDAWARMVEQREKR